MTATLFRQYISWVRENGENAQSLERLTQMAARIVTDPRNLVTTELAWTLINLHSLVNRTIHATAGRRVGRTEQVGIFLRTVSEVECLLELGLRRFCGHEAAWNVLLALQTLKCVLNLFVHQQLFIVPWIWAAVRRRLRLMLQQLMRLPEYGRRASSAVTERITASFVGRVPSAPSQAGTLGPANTRLVIPRVAVRRVHRRAAADNDDQAGVAETGASFPCTAMDLLGILVDLLLVLRPLLLLFCARRAFPAGAAGIAVLPVLPRAGDDDDGRGEAKKDEAAATTAPTDAPVRDDLALVHAVMHDGVSKSLLSSWGVGLSFFGLDAALALLSRHIRRHRVPVVYINNADDRQGPAGVAGAGGVRDGEVSSRGGDAGSALLDKAGANGNGDAAAPFLPRPPTGNVTEFIPAVSRDSLRVQQVLRNMAFSFLRDPFFPALLQQFVYRNFVVGRVNRIPLLGPILAFQVAYFLCKQHYCFMYLLEQ
ncbi:uncharacterized protein Tco025E_03170 [Trypanosoma conorhini]|uniref:Peroxisomal membrane protein PEX16 n=1 Tax=Trypanosoma conorhini TaxID=83891 RepID=A0A422PX05_9TRYP|nr:uncharacterized protein Tco025E_03170 [Trypanosoma conorhini]RNF22238.1 hypothetical protein Tco025E_03170 [Trypanosoma conorhini]